MLFERLRLETRDLHEQIEHCLPVLKPDFTLDGYRRLLRQYFGFYSPVEQQLEALLARGLSVFGPERRKLPLLIRDLEHLQAGQSEFDRIELCEILPSLETVSQGIGCLYVLEGSTLGGQIISRHLTERLGVTIDRGCAFFSSYGADLGRRWREFRECVSADWRANAEADEIVSSARTTFRCFNAWLATQSAGAE